MKIQAENNEVNMTMNIQPAAMILGEVASSGVARGPALVCACAEHAAGPRRTISETEAQKEMEKFDAAISEVEKDLLDLQKKSSRELERKKPRFLRCKFFFCTTPHCVRRSAPAV